MLASIGDSLDWRVEAAMRRVTGGPMLIEVSSPVRRDPLIYVPYHRLRQYLDGRLGSTAWHRHWVAGYGIVVDQVEINVGYGLGGYRTMACLPTGSLRHWCDAVLEYHHGWRQLSVDMHLLLVLDMICKTAYQADADSTPALIDVLGWDYRRNVDLATDGQGRAAAARALRLT